MQWTPEIWYHFFIPLFSWRNQDSERLTNTQYHAASKRQNWDSTSKTFINKPKNMSSADWILLSCFFFFLHKCLFSLTLFFFIFFLFLIFPHLYWENCHCSTKKLCRINVYILKSLDRGISSYYHCCNQGNKNSHPLQKFPLLFF